MHQSRNRYRTTGPSLRPIHCRWVFRVTSDQSIHSRLSSSRWAYAVMRANHWNMARCSTSDPQRSHVPPAACSSASTVRQSGHQVTGASFRYTSPAWNSFRKIHWVHL